MITKKVEIDDAGKHHVDYIGIRKDAIDNGDGTYSVPGAPDAKNANTFYAMDTKGKFTLMFDQENGVWHLQ